MKEIIRAAAAISSADGRRQRRRCLLNASLLAPAMLLGAAAAHAQAAEKPAASDEIVVTGRYRFLAADTSGTTNLPLSIEKVPQSISLVSNDFINAADLTTLGDIAQYTPGAIFAGNQEGYNSIIKLRGFTAGTAFDGLTINALTYEPDSATVDRMEIVKGPSSVVYGAASPGGLINIVSKGAHADTPSYLSLSGGSWGRWRVEGQVAGALDKAGNLRAIGVAVHEDADSFLKEVSSKKTALYGGLDLRLPSGLKAYVHGGYERYRRTSFDGIPTFADGSFAPVPRSFFIGSDEDNVTTRVVRVNAGLDWSVTPLWSVAVKANYQHAKTAGPSPYSFGLQPNGDFSFQIQNMLDYDAEDISVGASTIYKFDALGLIDSFFSASAMYQKTTLGSLQSLPEFNGNPTGTANIFNGVDAISAAIERAVFPGDIFYTQQKLEFVTLSGQVVVKPIGPLTLLAGLSWSKPKISSRSDSNPAQDFSGGDQISYRAAATLEVLRGLNAYFSYSQSFQPQLRIDINNRVLAPLSGKQYELGLKYATPDKRLLASVAVFDLRQANQGVYDQQGPDGFDRYRAVGEVRHRGVEMDLLGRVTHQWQINAGFSLLDPKVTKDDDASLIGKAITYLPKKTASLFTSYDFHSGFFVSAGIRYVDAVATSYDGSSRALPSYTLVDGGAGYARSHWRLQLNVHNLFNKRYYINNYQTTYYGNVVGAPRGVTGSVKYAF